MSKFDHDAFVAAWRAARPPEAKRIPQAEYDLVLAAIAGSAMPNVLPPHAVKPSEPAWTKAGRSKIGEREIPGSKHNPWITGFWQRLGAKWFNDDETPWCGGFMAWCLNEAGLPYPKEFPRAASFATYGVATKPAVGAIAVKARKGGNHVFQIVGETADKLYYKGLGGNQGNTVSIADFLKSEVDAIRWPDKAPPPVSFALPIMPKGTIRVSEA